MAQEKVRYTLGDQEPQNGGLLREEALRKKYPNAEVEYLEQDADTPWVEVGDAVNPKIKSGWGPTYWSKARRLPYAPSVPGTDIQELRNSPNGTQGLHYVVGPKTGLTTYGHKQLGDKSPLHEIDRKLRAEEERWFNYLRNVTGISGKANTQDLIKMRKDARGIVEHFRDNPVKLRKDLPHSYYWVVSREGVRHEYVGNQLRPGEVLVPKGVVLPLEMAASGKTIAATGLGYMGKTQEVRDKYVPGLKIPTARIEFKTTNAVDPMRAQVNDYNARKKARNTEPKVISEETLNKVSEYWSGRPTSASVASLESKVTTEITHETK
jgi:hypothetical protein